MSQAAADALVAEGDSLFRDQRYADALARYERAVQIFPTHPLGWKGVGNSLLCLDRAHDATRAFDRAIGLRPESATALWGGAVAHADAGNRVIAQNYLRRSLSLQPTWIEMARQVPQLAPFLQLSNVAADLVRAALGAYSARTYRHATDENRWVEVGRLAAVPAVGQFTFVTLGLSNTAWPNPTQPRVELVLATTIDNEVCGQILANLAFHLTATQFFPEPGAMVRDVVGALGLVDLSQRLPHVYLAAPRGFGVHLPLDSGPPPITLCQVIPVSEGEYHAWRQHPTAFEGELARRGVDIADLRRPG